MTYDRWKSTDEFADELDERDLEEQDPDMEPWWKPGTPICLDCGKPAWLTQANCPDHGKDTEEA